jgi:hypothetical protein
MVAESRMGEGRIHVFLTAAYLHDQLGEHGRATRGYQTVLEEDEESTVEEGGETRDATTLSS